MIAPKLVLETSFYIIGGTVERDAPCYVERRADTDLYEGLQQGKFCYVLTSRQMGKSSLMVRTAARLREEGVGIAVLDLTAIGQNLTAEQWYDGLLTQIAQQLDLDDELEEFWAMHSKLGPLQRWMQAIRHVVLPRYPGRVVIFVDEIDAVRSLPFLTDEFFAGIREFYNRRTEDSELERLTFCLLGVATPSDLIRDTRTTPFNIGQRIELTDFTEAEATPLIQGLGREESVGKSLLKRVLYWTSGHPYLTQRLCQAVAEEASVKSAADVDRLCAELFLSHRAQERDDNLLFVRERILRSEADLVSLFDLYMQVRGGKHVADEVTNPLVGVLRLSGITRVEGRYLRVRNHIYERVFDREWVRANMPDAEVRRQRAAYRRGVWRTAIIAAVMLISLAGLALTAIKQRNRAQEQEQDKSRLLYAARMNLAGQDWETANIGRMTEYLNAYLPQPGQADLRGFEWHYLWRLSHRSLMTMQHGNIALAVAFSPDGKKLASVGRDGSLKLWDVATGRELATFNGQTGILFSVAFSPDGKRLASGSSDRTVWLWDAITGQGLSVIRGHTGSVRSIAFSPDGKLLASGSADQAKLWEAATGRELLTLKGFSISSRSTGLAFSPDGQQLASVSDGNLVRLWNVATGQEMRAFKGHTSGLCSVAFSPDGKKLASGSVDRTIKLWDVATGQELLTLKGHNALVYSVAFSPDGKQVGSTSGDGTVKLWDAVTGQEQFTFKEHTGHVNSIVYSPDGQKIATCSQDQTVKLWSAAIEPEKIMLKNYTWADGLHFLPDGKLIAGSTEGVIRLRDLTTGSERVVFKAPGHLIAPAGVSLDGKRTVIVDSDNQAIIKIKLIDIAMGRDLAVLWTGDTSPICLDVSRDLKLLAIGSKDGALRVWEIATGKEVLTVQADTGITDVAFSPDGQRVASAGALTTKLWDMSTGKELFQFTGHTNTIYMVTFSPDGHSLATASADRTVRLWDAVTGREIARLSGHTNTATRLAFSPDGRRLASGGFDQTVKLWDVRTGQELLTLKGHTSEVMRITFSPDGQWLASGGADGQVMLWRAATEREVTASLKQESASQVVQTTPVSTVSLLSVAFSPDGKRLVSGDGKGTLKLSELATGRELAKSQGHTGGIATVAFSPDGKRVASGGNDWAVKLWDAATLKEVAMLKGHAGQIQSVAFSPDGLRLATASFDQTMKLWEATTGREITTLRGHAGSVTSVAFSPDGQTLVSGSADNTIKLWDAATGRELATLTGHTSTVRDVAFSPNGKLIASGCHDRTIKLWDVTTLKEVATLKGHTGFVFHIAFSPDGQKLASGGNDSRIKLWDVNTRQELLTLKELIGAVQSLAFSPDGQTLVAADGDSTLKLWEVATGKLLTTEPTGKPRQ